MSLQQEIASWDKGAVEDLEEIYDRHASETDLGSELVDHLLEQGMPDEAASVKARVRNIRKDLR